MNQKISIAKVNNVSIIVINDEEKRVAIRPICEALGVSIQKQLERLKSDPILNSVITLRVTTGADGKQYEMQTLPLKYVFGWLFRIDSRNVKEEAREAVLKYQMECYDVLYNHFFGSMEKQIEVNREEVKLLEQLNEMQNQRTEINSKMKKIKKDLEIIRTERCQAKLF